MLGYDHGDYWTGASTADVIGEQLQVLFPDVSYRPPALRPSSLPERPTLDETALLPDYALAGF